MDESTSVSIPSRAELLKAGVQFGHETKRWNPKMKKFIYGEKNKIHVIDIEQTEKGLKDAVAFLKDASSKGNVLFVGTKRQVTDIIKDEAIRSGSYFINFRWAGGLLTNFPIVKKSLSKLNELEAGFETGVEDRTKYEISRMKKDWQRLVRLYSGIKALTQKPVAIVLADTNYEKSAIREAKKLNIPIVAIVDTNCDPDTANYIIPANDDAIGSLTLIFKILADAVLAGNKGNGIKHTLKDYSKIEVKVIKKQVESEDKELVTLEEQEAQNSSNAQSNNAPTTPSSSRSKSKGILERYKDAADAKSKPVEAKASTTKVSRTAEPKTIKKSEPKVVKKIDTKVSKKTETKASKIDAKASKTEKSTVKKITKVESKAKTTKKK